MHNRPETEKAFKARWPFFALLLFIGLALYSNSFNASFHMDDEDSIVTNRAIRHVSDIRTIWAFYPSRFLTYFSFAVNYALGGLDVAGYHLFNVTLHLLSGLLVYQLAMLTASSTPTPNENLKSGAHAASAFAALIFLCHPLQVGAVTYIVQRAVVMSSFFYLAALVCYIRGVKEGARGYRYTAIAAAALSIFSKEMAMTLPLALTLYDRIFFSKKGGAFVRLLPFYLVTLLVPAALVFSGNFNVGKFQLVIDASERPATLHYFFTQLKVFLTYAGLLFCPVRQNFDYDYPLSRTILDPAALAGLAAVLAVLVAGLALIKKGHSFKGFSLVWFFLLLLPESSFFPIHDLAVEHRLYLPVAAFSMALSAAVCAALNKKTAVFLLSAFTIFLFILAYARNDVMRNDISLWSDTIQKSPLKARAYLARGIAYSVAGKEDLALKDLNRCLEIEPKYVRAYNSRAILYQRQGNAAAALADYEKIFSINPKFFSGYINRGALYYAQGDMEKAITDWTAAIGIDPAAESAYANRAIAYDIKGDLRSALDDLNMAVSLNPLGLNSLLTRIRLYYKLGYDNECIADIRKARKISKDLPEDILRLGESLGLK